MSQRAGVIGPIDIERIIRSHVGDDNEIVDVGLAAEEIHLLMLAAAPAAQGSGWRDGIEKIKTKIDLRMNNRLCEIKQGYDDSITGFNEAWDIVRGVFSEANIRSLAAPPVEAQGSERE